MFHCHIEFHVEVGMALIFKVGEHSQMPPVPQDFPRCGNYFPAPLTPSNSCQTDDFLVNALKKLLPLTLDSNECSNSTPLQRFTWAMLIIGVILMFVR